MRKDQQNNWVTGRSPGDYFVIHAPGRHVPRYLWEDPLLFKWSLSQYFKLNGRETVFPFILELAAPHMNQICYYWCFWCSQPHLHSETLLEWTTVFQIELYRYRKGLLQATCQITVLVVSFLASPSLHSLPLPSSLPCYPHTVLETSLPPKQVQLLYFFF